MVDYIEREALIDVLAVSHAHHANTCREASLLDRDIRLIREQPAADVVPVVRCKDCKYRDPENQSCDHFMSTGMPFPRRHNDFCSYGERRADHE